MGNSWSPADTAAIVFATREGRQPTREEAEEEAVTLLLKGEL